MSANPDPEVPITPIAADDRSTRFLFSCYCMKLYGASAALVRNECIVAAAIFVM